MCPVTARAMGSTELVNDSAPSESRRHQMNRPSNRTSFGILKPICKVAARNGVNVQRHISSSVSSLPRSKKQKTTTGSSHIYYFYKCSGHNLPLPTFFSYLYTYFGKLQLPSKIISPLGENFPANQTEYPLT